jgi:tetratricopeptide (TPR) repeat protein
MFGAIITLLLGRHLFVILQAPAQGSNWLSNLIRRITPTWWVVMGVLGLVLVVILLYYFTIDEIELGIPPKLKFKRRVDPTKEPAAIQSGPAATQLTSQNVPDQPSPSTVVSPTIQPNLVHPYPLQANFTGRVKEREELTAWLDDDECPIYELVAMGGMGKSALTWYWLKNDVLTSSETKLDGVMWWSFYEGESSFSKFVDEGLKYVSGHSMIDANRFPTTYDRAQELRRLLQNKRVLFVLDGFERQLRAYARIDAAYLEDDVTEPNQLTRACVDPVTSRLLRDITSGTTRSKALLTTRLPVSDLEDRASAPLEGTTERELSELSREDALTFMHAQGVTKGTSSEIANACEAYGYHPLSLRLLSGLISRDMRTPNDIAAAPRHDVHDDLVQRQHHILAHSYNALPEKERALLSRIAAFRSPMTYDALLIFNEFGDESKFDAVLNDLRVRGLLQRDTAHDRYDLHPIVRHYAYDRLSDKTGVHTQLRDYFAKVPVPEADNVRSIDDLAPVMELYHHTTRAGLYDDACDLYYQRLWDLLYYQFGAYQTQVELLGALVPIRKEQKPRLKKESDQAWAMSELANASSTSGQPRKAIVLFEQTIAIYEKLGDKLNLAIGLDNIAMQQLIVGALSISERNLRRSIALCRELASKLDEAAGHQGLGRLLAYRGAFNEAEPELMSAQRAFDAYGVGRTNFVTTIRADHALSYFLKRDYELMTDYAMEARKLALLQTRSMYGGARDIIRSNWLVGWAMVMQKRDLNEAASHLTEALMSCRRINLVENEPDILLTWARWHHAKGNAQEGLARAEEALAIANRCEYRLTQAEIHNFLALLALDNGDRDKAREEAEIAKERAWCDGPPHCYKPALDEAEKMLKELGAGP